MMMTSSIYALADDEARTRRRATKEEAIADLGLVGACRVNFVPTMLGAAQLDAAIQLCDAARDKRLSEIKPETRRIKQVCKAWGKVLDQSMGVDETNAFRYCIEAVGEFTTQQRWIAFQKIRVDALNQVSGDPDIAAWGEWFRMLDRERRDFEAKMDEFYGRYVNVTFRNAQRIVMLHIGKEIRAIRKKGFEMLATPEAWPAPGVMRNKAWDMADLLADKKL